MDTCMDTCMDMCMDICRHVCGHVNGKFHGHMSVRVHGYVCALTRAQTCAQAYAQACLHACALTLVYKHVDQNVSRRMYGDALYGNLDGTSICTVTQGPSSMDGHADMCAGMRTGICTGMSLMTYKSFLHSSYYDILVIMTY